ncbi:hypothetical protein [Treponema sp. OMZ 805]|uniref:hypothetical protein n=1 Tax=Treponema sp. OMZ 805 TaxID=2726068 RepID=UPI003D948EBF
MIKTYHFNYDYGVAEVTIVVDTNIFTQELAEAILGADDWYLIGVTDPIDTVIENCAMDVIKAGVQFGDNLPAIKEYIQENNELKFLGDKSGIKVIDFKPFQFDDTRLELEKVEVTEGKY